MEKAKQFGKPVQVGIIIPKSAGMAKFMNNNVAGIHVPDEMIEELKADKEKTKAVSLVLRSLHVSSKSASHTAVMVHISWHSDGSPRSRHFWSRLRLIRMIAL